MAVVRDGQAPYAPTEAVMTVIEGYRTKHPHTPFTVDNIQPLGVSPSIAPRTHQALRLLDLIDDAGEPTPALDVLREASSSEFPARLAEVIRAAYPEVFAYKDPSTDAPEDMQEVFRFYKPPSMQPRMIRLFYGLCAHAGIIESAPAIESSGKTARRKPAASPATGKAKDGATKRSASKATTINPPPPPPPRGQTLDALKARYIEVLLKKFEQSKDEALNVELADRIERLMGFKSSDPEDT